MKFLIESKNYHQNKLKNYILVNDGIFIFDIIVSVPVVIFIQYLTFPVVKAIKAYI